MSFQTTTTAAWKKIGGLIDGFIAMRPNIVLAIVVFIIFFFVYPCCYSIYFTA